MPCPFGGSCNPRKLFEPLGQLSLFGRHLRAVVTLAPLFALDGRGLQQAEARHQTETLDARGAHLAQPLTQAHEQVGDVRRPRRLEAHMHGLPLPSQPSRPSIGEGSLAHSRLFSWRSKTCIATAISCAISQCRAALSSRVLVTPESCSSRLIGPALSSGHGAPRSRASRGARTG